MGETLKGFGIRHSDRAPGNSPRRGAWSRHSSFVIRHFGTRRLSQFASNNEKAAANELAAA
jgi:hypothetical protein